MAKTLAGHWKLESSEHFDEYMKAVGVNFMLRKMAGTAKPEQFIKFDGEEWNIQTKSLVKNSNITFSLGNEFEETTADGRNCKTVVTLEGDKLTMNQGGVDIPSVIVRELQDGGDTMVMSLIAKKDGKDVTCTRKYKRADS